MAVVMGTTNQDMGNYLDCSLEIKYKLQCDLQIVILKKHSDWLKSLFTYC